MGCSLHGYVILMPTLGQAVVGTQWSPDILFKLYMFILLYQSSIGFRRDESVLYVLTLIASLR